MITFSVILAVVVSFFCWLGFQHMVRWHRGEMEDIRRESKELQEDLDTARRENNRLKSRKAELEEELTLAQYNIERESQKSKGPKKSLNADTYCMDWLVKNGHITLEAREKCERVAKSSSESAINTCSTLGYINKATYNAAYAAFKHEQSG